jgi:hypothetical protein
MKIIKFFTIILYIPLFLVILITMIGLLHHWFNPGIKSISNTDLKHLSLVLGLNLVLILIMKFAKRQI